MTVFPTLSTSGRHGPTAIRIGEDFIGVLMPVSPPAGEKWAYERPGWLTKTAGAVETAVAAQAEPERTTVNEGRCQAANPAAEAPWPR